MASNSRQGSRSRRERPNLIRRWVTRVNSSRGMTSTGQWECVAQYLLTDRRRGWRQRRPPRVPTTSRSSSCPPSDASCACGRPMRTVCCKSGSPGSPPSASPMQVTMTFLAALSSHLDCSGSHTGTACPAERASAVVWAVRGGARARPEARRRAAVQRRQPHATPAGWPVTRRHRRRPCPCRVPSPRPSTPPLRPVPSQFCGRTASKKDMA